MSVQTETIRLVDAIIRLSAWAQSAENAGEYDIAAPVRDAVLLLAEAQARYNTDPPVSYQLAWPAGHPFAERTVHVR